MLKLPPIPKPSFILHPFAFILLLSSLACGPFFPNQLLLNRDDQLLLSAPSGNLAHELSLLNLKSPNSFKPLPPADKQDVYTQSAAIDDVDLSFALAHTNLSAQTRDATLDQYRTVRAAIAAHAAAMEDLRTSRLAGAKDKLLVPLHVTLPDNLPPEFSLYATGLIAFHEDHPDGARAAWTQLLSLPRDQRRNRSTWASYMLGKSLLTTDAAQSIHYFELTRTLATQNFHDSLGLAASSIGWQARAELNRHHYRDALLLYLSEYALGSPTALNSIPRAIDAAFTAGPDALSTLAADAACRRAVAACLVSPDDRYPTPLPDNSTQSWLSALESQHITDAPGADRLAWAAYNAGLFPLASRYCNLAPATSPMALWIRSKLLLRAGKIDDAIKCLSQAAASFPLSESWPVDTDSAEYKIPENPAEQTRAELGALRLTRGQYVDSLDLLLHAGSWTDAAYVAERVLTPDELQSYVDHHFPSSTTPANPKGDPDPDAGDFGHHPTPDTTPATLRYLLARRLTRVGRWKDARPYYPPTLQPTLDTYITSLRTGLDPTQPNSTRASSLWTAAQIARNDGMDLLATELAPDNHLYAGSYPSPPLPQSRATTSPSVLNASAPELSRISKSAPTPNTRFHYRYIAADHAYAAAQFLPDDTDLKATILNTAGLWLAAADPQSANRFYKSLVQSCPHTPLGQRAIAKHWLIPSSPH